ncbi:MAG: hypothetical protein L6R41_005787 [Letrouitia leprolyta]|nr:MAG: hypothetical protein L6R41_005787 [Letrouitia leprolyta]
MEGRANCSPSYKSPDPMSRIQQDLNEHHSKWDSLIRTKSPGMLRRIMPKGRKPRVCVIGAGVAGMRCAQVLGEKGMDVTVLEARDRTAPELPPSIYDQSGHLLSQEEGQKCSELMWGIIEEAFEYSNKHSASIPQEQSLLDFFKLKLREKDLPESSRERILQVCRSWGDYIGGSIEKQSLKYFWLEETIDGENLFLASTYKPILSKLTQDTYTHASVHLSTKVTSITSNSSPPSQDEEPSTYTSISITTSEKQVLEYDEIITTAPLGCLKSTHEHAFHPPLPSRIQKAIKNLSYGRLEKVYLTFPSAFWLAASSSELSPSTATTTTSPISLTAPSTESSLNPFFNQWLSPLYTPHHYPVECVFLSSLPSPHAHPTLLFYMHGALATHITTTTSPLDPSSPEYLATLTEFFKPYYSRLPNFGPGKEECTPTHALATNWSNDPLAGYGSYSNFLIPEQTNLTGEKDIPDPNLSESEEIELDHDIEALRHGCPERRLWFAGEHTSPFVALGTVTGAWWSGEKVARRILGAWGMGGGGADGEGEVDGEKIKANGVEMDADGVEGAEEGKVGSKHGGIGMEGRVPDG